MRYTFPLDLSPVPTKGGWLMRVALRRWWHRRELRDVEARRWMAAVRRLEVTDESEASAARARR